MVGASSLMEETRLPVSGLRNVSSFRPLDDISSLFSSVARSSDDNSLLVVSALERPVSPLYLKQFKQINCVMTIKHDKTFISFYFIHKPTPTQERKREMKRNPLK